MKNIVITLILTTFLISCAGEKSTKVEPLRKEDKMLSCKEIMLEMNEAEFYQKSAEDNKTPGVSSFLLPLGYVSTYMNAADASDAAKARIDYLRKIYGILECEKKPEYQAQF